MANPTDISQDDMSVLSISSTGEVSVDVNKRRIYSVAHNGQDSAGLASTVPVYCSAAKAVDTDSSEADDKAILFNGWSFDLGPGLDTLKFRTASGEATITVIATLPK